MSKRTSDSIDVVWSMQVLVFSDKLSCSLLKKETDNMQQAVNLELFP